MEYHTIPQHRYVFESKKSHVLKTQSQEVRGVSVPLHASKLWLLMFLSSCYLPLSQLTNSVLMFTITFLHVNMYMLMIFDSFPFLRIHVLPHVLASPMIPDMHSELSH